MSGSDSGTGSQTRHNDPALQIANRQTWTVTGIGQDGSLILHGQGHAPRRDREVPAAYATSVTSSELAYATTVHGAQGDTVESAHVLVGEHTGASAGLSDFPV